MAALAPQKGILPVRGLEWTTYHGHMVVLEENGLLKAEKATCYPAPNFISALGEKYTGKDVESCGNFITANGPRAAMAFSLEICKKLGITPGF